MARDYFAEVEEGEADVKADWVHFVENFLPRKFRRYDYESKRDELGSEAIKKVVEAIRKGDPFIFTDYLDGIFYESTYEPEYDAYQQALTEFSKEWAEPAVVKDQLERDSWFRDEFNIIYESREENNWWYLIEGIPLLVWNKPRHAGWVGDPQDSYTEVKENPELKAFAEEAIQYISDAAIGRIIDNGFDYDVTLFIGGIYDAGNILKWMAEDGVPKKVHTGDVIVGAWDGLNGAGFFEHGTTNQHVDNVFGDPRNPIRVDFGSYSLGDVFGTNEWRWH